jgi:hypothetical protein
LPQINFIGYHSTDAIGNYHTLQVYQATMSLLISEYGT